MSFNSENFYILNQTTFLGQVTAYKWLMSFSKHRECLYNIYDMYYVL